MNLLLFFEKLVRWILSLSFYFFPLSKIDNNYDKHLGFFNEWKIKEVKVGWVMLITYSTAA